MPYTMTKHAPTPDDTAFDCPHCSAYSQQTWGAWSGLERIPDSYRRDTSPGQLTLKQYLELDVRGEVDVVRASMRPSGRLMVAPLYAAVCARCRETSLWKVDEGDTPRMIWPAHRRSEPPHPDMPEDMVRDYEEASAIFQASPRAASALLRLVVEKLCKRLDPEARSQMGLARRIDRLAKAGTLSDTDLAVLAVVKDKGNQAVHGEAGNIAEDEGDGYESLFPLINMIVETQISRPHRVKLLHKKQMCTQ